MAGDEVGGPHAAYFTQGAYVAQRVLTLCLDTVVEEEGGRERIRTRHTGEGPQLAIAGSRISPRLTTWTTGQRFSSREYE